MMVKVHFMLPSTDGTVRVTSVDVNFKQALMLEDVSRLIHTSGFAIRSDKSIRVCSGAVLVIEEVKS